MQRVRLVLVALALIGLVGSAVFAATDAKETTVSGKYGCAKCTFKKADVKECADMIVADDGAEYYIVKNDVSEKFGHGCHGTRQATVTGTVTEKDGKQYITATKIDAAEQGGESKG